MTKKSEQIRILAVEGSSRFREIYACLFEDSIASGSGSYDIRTADDIDKSFTLIDRLCPDIVLLDACFLDNQAFDFCAKIRQRKSTKPYIGVILIIDGASSAMVADGLAIGADDVCSLKGADSELVARIKSVHRIKQTTDSLHQMNTKLRSANKRLSHMSITDELSGLYNMRYFKKRLSQEFQRALRYKANLSLIMMDLDKFKLVNDECDHLMGSFVLSEVGRLISQSIRKIDIAARFGGDEYVILLPETDPAGAYTIADRIFQVIASTPFNNGPYQLNVTASMGVATAGPAGGNFVDSTQLLRCVDHSLYEAKEQGRAQITQADYGRLLKDR